MKVNVDVSYAVESDNPATEGAGLRILEDEVQVFASSIRARLAEAGIEIEQFSTEQS